jgi:hypothetical protein
VHFAEKIVGNINRRYNRSRSMGGSINVSNSITIEAKLEI